MNELKSVALCVYDHNPSIIFTETLLCSDGGQPAKEVPAAQIHQHAVIFLQKYRTADREKWTFLSSLRTYRLH